MVTGKSDKKVTPLVWRSPDFRWFWFGQSVSVMGSQVTAVAMPFVAALTLHAGLVGVSAVATAAYLPNVVVPLLAGHLLDSRRRRTIMVIADAVRAVTVAVVPAAAILHALTLPLLLTSAFVAGSAGVVFDIGSFAYVVSMLDERDLTKANQATQGSATAAQVVGPGLGGLLVQAMGPTLAMAVDALSFVASALGMMAARRPEPPPPATEARTGIFTGLRQVLGDRVLRSLTVHAAVYNAASQILTVNLVIYAVQRRDVSPGQYGLALSAAGIGAFVGTMVSLRVSRRWGYGHTFIASLALSTGTPLLIAAIPFTGLSFAVALAGLQVVSGLGLGSANVLSVTLRQVVAPRGSLARTNAGYRLLIYGVIPIGSALGGVIGAGLGVRAGVTIGAVGLTVSALPMLARPIRRLRTPEDARRTG